MKISSILIPALLFGSPILLLAVVVLTSSCDESLKARLEYCRGKIVKSVGGCNLLNCGVQWADGTYGTMSYPAEGMPCK